MGAEAQAFDPIYQMLIGSGPLGVLMAGYIALTELRKRRSNGLNGSIPPEEYLQRIEKLIETKMAALPCQSNPAYQQERLETQNRMVERLDELQAEIMGARLDLAGLKGELKGQIT